MKAGIFYCHKSPRDSGKEQMDFKESIEQIQRRLAESTPRKLQWPEFTPAAVLIPFLNRQGEPHVLLTMRTDTVEHHKGQISFPGGAREPQDRSLLETAIRETEEELGIPGYCIHILGEADDFPTITNFMVTPFACVVDPIPEYRPNQAEVAKVLEVPLDIFLTDRHFEIQKRTYNGQTFPVFFY
ncbi:MAG: CoA pyrophosphatase, partial [Calditrichaeota bacterium]